MAETTVFNPNELILERVRNLREYDITTDELTGRYTQVEDASLQTSADGQDVTDALGAVITTFYNAQSGTFSFSNSIFSMDLAASQFGSEKVVASADNKIVVPVSETITIAGDNTVTLKYVPVGVEGSEINSIKIINADNTFGKKYVVSSTAGDGKFTIDAANKKLTLPAGTTGKVIVDYEYESANAVMVEKRTDGVPKVKKLIIDCIFHDKCDPNKVLRGYIVCPRAQIDPSSVELSLTADGKHPASYLLRKDYCDEDAKLFYIVITQD